MKYSLPISVGIIATTKSSLANGIGYLNKGEKFMESTTPKITPKESEVLVWVQRALSNKQIARELNMSESTAKMHVKNLFRKYGVHNRTQLSTFSLQGQSIDLKAYLPKDLEATPCCWTLSEKGKVVAFSLQKKPPTPEWEPSYTRKKNETNN